MRVSYRTLPGAGNQALFTAALDRMGLYRRERIDPELYSE